MKILEGRWQDFLNTTARDSNDEEEEEEGEEWVEGKTKGIGAVLEGSHEGGGFDFVFMDTFAEGYEGESPFRFLFSSNAKDWKESPDGVGGG